MNPSILVIDDDPDHLELTVMALGECCDSREIHTCTDGVEAIDFLLARGSYAGRDPTRQPRLLLLDMNLARMDGLHVLKTLRQDPRTSAIPVVMHSSSIENGDIAACYAHGANSYVRKATNYDELRRKMRQVHDFWLTVNEPPRPA